jgi:hypothetical protein
MGGEVRNVKNQSFKREPHGRAPDACVGGPGSPKMRPNNSPAQTPKRVDSRGVATPLTCRADTPIAGAQDRPDDGSLQMASRGWRRNLLPSSWRTPIVRLHMFHTDAGRTACTRPLQCRGVALGDRTAKAPARGLSTLNSMAFGLAVSASQCGLPRHHARLASGRWSAITGRAFHPQGSAGGRVDRRSGWSTRPARSAG